MLHAAAHTSSFPRVVRPHEDLQGSRVGHTGQQLGQVGFWQQTFPITQNLGNKKHTHIYTQVRERKVRLSVWCTVCVLILSLGVPDGCRNHYTSLHQRDTSAMSAEGSRSGRQKKKKKGTELCERHKRSSRGKGTGKRDVKNKTEEELGGGSFSRNLKKSRGHISDISDTDS